MAEIDIPTEGLVLDRFLPPTANPNNLDSPQVMRLDLADGILDELIRCARSGSKPMSLEFGKQVVSMRHPQMDLYPPSHG